MKRLILLLAALAAGLSADEGIWLPNSFPKAKVERKFGFVVADGFLSHLQKASVKLGSASGSFVSPRGLLFTNHHVASECIQRLSTAEHDYMRDGFYAARPEDEQKCPDFDASVLLSIEDVTARVNAGVARETPEAEANRLRKANMAQIEKECSGPAGVRCEVVTLYSGGEYHLYRYKMYTDVRLVFAPEFAIAAFGGDPDNFTYPRFCLDIAFLRAYEDGKPAQTPDYLRWSAAGVKEGGLVFVSGHPAATGRLDTVAQLEFFRDVSYPLIRARLASLIQTLQQFSAQSPEHRRIALDNLFSQQNSYKAYTGFLEGLRDEKRMKARREEEQEMRRRVKRSRDLGDQYGNAWEEVRVAYDKFRSFYKPYWLLESSATRGSELMRIARDVVRLAEEKTKPDAQRLREYRDAALPALQDSLYAEVPIDEPMEFAVIANYFEFLAKALGADDPAVKALLGGRSPLEAARGYVSGTRLKDVAERKRLAASVDAVHSSGDGMIRLALILDESARRYRKQYEDSVEAVLRSSAARIARARFAILGAAAYPDATFTLRFSYGAVTGYKNSAGKRIHYATTFEDLYRRATGEEPFRLPERWIRAKDQLALGTPFNFVSTADTHGGNSGSPTVDTRGELVGILFDGNLEGLPNRFFYGEERERSIHVAAQGIVEALRTVYDADRLLKELGVVTRSAAAVP